jgi:hypothetical protein
VGELLLDGAWVPDTHLVKEGRSHRPEAVRRHLLPGRTGDCLERERRVRQQLLALPRAMLFPAAATLRSEQGEQALAL